MRFVLFYCKLFLILQIFKSILAQDVLNVKILSEVHDFVEEAYDVAISNEYVYLSSGLSSGLRVLDISSPAVPVEIGYAINTDLCPGVLNWMTDRIRVSGNYVYILYFDGTWSFTHYRLYVYDVSNPVSPQQMGYVSLPDNCTSLFVADDFVYITAFEDVGISEVLLVDVSDPMHPIISGSFATPGMANDVYVTDNCAYIADNDSLIIFAITENRTLEKIGSYAPEINPVLFKNVAARGGYVYLADVEFGLRVLDASNLPQIKEIAALPHNETDVHYSQMKICDNYLYYLQDGEISDKKLNILEISDPELPELAGSHTMPGFWWIYGFDYCDEYACIAGGKEGLRIVKIAAVDSISDICTYDKYDLTSGLSVARNHAFVGTYMKNLVVYDVSDPLLPVEVTALEFPDSPIKRISIWGDHLYIPGVKMNHDCGVSVFDITDPSNPKEIAYWPSPPGYSGAPFNVERYKDYAVIACAFGGVEVYNVAQLDQPMPLDNWTLWDPLTNQDFGVINTKISWPYVFAPDRVFGLYVLDISNPADIKEVAKCATPGEAMWADISADHRYVFVADGHAGLRIIDVSDPLAPAEIGFHEDILEMATHVTVSGDSVYVCDGGSIGLHIFNVSDPTRPVEVACHKTPGAYAHDVVVSNDLVYFLDFTHFEIFQISTEPSAVKNIELPAVITDCSFHATYPNPFNATTKIVFDLAQCGYAQLEIYNYAGQKIRTLLQGYYRTGRYQYIFKAYDLASGVYILRLAANGTSVVQKLILVK